MTIHMDTKIRRLHLVEGVSIRKYIHGETIPGGKQVMIRETLDFIEACIFEDNDHTHLKQKYTTNRVSIGLKEEIGFLGSYSSVKVAFRELKSKTKEIFYYFPLILRKLCKLIFIQRQAINSNQGYEKFLLTLLEKEILTR